ncbi:MAG: hypothetical protein KDB37_10855 [Ilumatobacter sp.]|nr:hypothetical protein [Ilumatobacter sp.]
MDGNTDEHTGDSPADTDVDEATLTSWRQDWRNIPKEQWPVAAAHGWRGPLGGWAPGLGPKRQPTKEEAAAQNVVEYEFDKLGIDLGNSAWIVDRKVEGAPIVAFRIGADGTVMPSQAPWDRSGAIGMVQVTETGSGRDRRYTASIQVWNIFDRRLTDHGWSVIHYTGPDADNAENPQRIAWYCDDAMAENPYQAIRRALHKAFGDGEFGVFDVGRQPHTTAGSLGAGHGPLADRDDANQPGDEHGRPAPSQDGERAPGRRKRRVAYIAGATAAAGSLTLGVSMCGTGPTADEVNQAALLQMQDDAVIRELTAEEEAARSACEQSFGTFELDTGTCNAAPSDANAGDDPVSDTDADPVEQSSDAQQDPDTEAADCTAGGGTFDLDTGICTAAGAEHFAAVGLRSAGSPTADPAGGQSGSYAGEWRVTAIVDIQRYGAVVGSFVGDVFDRTFGNSAYPCDVVGDGYRTTCPLAAAELAPGDYVIVTMTVGAPIEPDGTNLQYGLAFDDGSDDNNYRGQPPFDLDLFNDAELWYRLEIDPDGERTLYADGYVDGHLGVPRPSSALAIEMGDTLAWVIPRDELPDGELRYRLTSFSNDGGPLVAPDPSTSGGDVSGADVSTLDVIGGDTVVAALDDAIPADIAPGRARITPSGDREQELITAMVADLATRWNAALQSGDPIGGTLDVLHPASTLTSVDGCVSFAERIFPGATAIELAPPITGWVLDEYFISVTVDASVTYPTGTNEYPMVLAVAAGDQIAPLFACDD